jgi:hypothetical protein
MPQPSLTPGRRTAADLIDAVIDNMRQNLEQTRYATLAPSRYIVYLSAAELVRLEGIIPRLQTEAARALDEELDRHNRPSWLRRRLSWLPRSRRAPLENAGPAWHVDFLCDADGELVADGDIVVHSDLVLAPDLELGVGERTRRITTVRSGDHTTTRRQLTDAAPDPGRVRARLTYRDKLGEHQHDVVRDRTTIGRGGIAFPVDIRLVTSEDVSREHIRIRRDARTAQFYLIDLSSLGTTVNGRHVPRGVEDHEGTRRENGAETALPARARIGLAETVFLDFEQGPS